MDESGTHARVGGMDRYLRVARAVALVAGGVALSGAAGRDDGAARGAQQGSAAARRCPQTTPEAGARCVPGGGAPSVCTYPPTRPMACGPTRCRCVNDPARPRSPYRWMCQHQICMRVGPLPPPDLA